MQHERDIAIIGGGMAGLAMAVALARLDFTITLVDRSPLNTQHLPDFDGRVSAIALGSQRMLERLGVWQHMQPHAQPIYDIRVSDGASPFFLHYDHEEVGEEPFGWIVENRHTRKALFDVVQQHDNITLYQASVCAIAQDANGATVQLDDQSELRTRMVIGADGKFSRLRELAGIAVHQVNYPQTAIVCTISHTQPHNGLAQERFLPRGPFAVLPMQPVAESLADDHSKCQQSSLVWVEPTQLAKHYLSLDKVSLASEIASRTGDYLGDISVSGEVFSYPLALSLAESFSAGRVCLVGDAAHAIHPIAGQGINLGFRDVAVLAELIEQHGLDAPLRIAADYARWRRLDTLAMAGVTDTLNRLFSNNLAPVRLARGLGLYAVSKLPRLKKIFMRHAMGVSGDLPALMKP